jgi:hypothetical protein
VHNYALVPPIRNKKKQDKLEIDPETHPLMKPYREQSNGNPVMVSFGHRPKSASRTFHPGTMRIRLGHGEIADTAAAEGKNGIGLPPSVLAQLLRAPRIPRPGEELAEDGEPGGGELHDPNGLFLPNDQLFGKSQSAPTLGAKSSNRRGMASSWQDGDGQVGPSMSGLVIGEGSSDFLEGGGDDVCRRSTGGRLKGGTGKKKQSSGAVDHPKEWKRDFHIIEKQSNAVFELRKSGIAETKLMPLKDRLTRCDHIPHTTPYHTIPYHIGQ